MRLTLERKQMLKRFYFYHAAVFETKNYIMKLHSLGQTYDCMFDTYGSA